MIETIVIIILVCMNIGQFLTIRHAQKQTVKALNLVDKAQKRTVKAQKRTHNAQKLTDEVLALLDRYKDVLENGGPVPDMSDASGGPNSSSQPQD